MQPSYYFTLLSLLLIFSCENSIGQDHEANHLINESSPYLLQHAYNPVDWHPWNDEALAKAKEEQKMLIISIGYSSCHWCHVMEHESFEDTTVSRIMNENFISIKVDREERPDIDNVYMTACQLSSGKGCGWPLNAFALPDGRPVWAGTYFPKKNWIEILEYFNKLYKEEPEQLDLYASQITEGIQNNDQLPITTKEAQMDFSAANELADKIFDQIDYKDGGLKGAPKFPMPVTQQFLLDYHHRTNQKKALDAVEISLTQMANGGIYDHLGGGFARYSTDAKWKVPHFEKMLYDNGQLVSLYSNAYKVTKNPYYKDVITQTLAYIEREMTEENGGFYSSLDADSEGEEGKFYVWESSEIKDLIEDPVTEELFINYYSVTEKGNWEENNILYNTLDLESIAAQFDLPTDTAKDRLNQAKQLLLKEREKRVRPGLDDKILTSWNALMLKGYCDAYHALGEKSYLETAIKNGEFISNEMMESDGRLNRNYKDGKATINAFLDDYALTIEAFLALYGATFDEKWLNRADLLAKYAITHFYNSTTTFFNYTSKLDPPLIANKTEISDNVIPASNSALAKSLYNLGLYLYKQDYLEKAQQMISKMAPVILETDVPSYYANWASLFMQYTQPTYEVAIVGPDFEALRAKMAQMYLPNVILLGGAAEGNLELLKDKLQEGETYIYVCQNKVCQLPVQSAEEALKQIK